LHRCRPRDRNQENKPLSFEELALGSVPPMFLFIWATNNPRPSVKQVRFHHTACFFPMFPTRNFASRACWCCSVQCAPCSGCVGHIAGEAWCGVVQLPQQGSYGASRATSQAEPRSYSLQDGPARSFFAGPCACFFYARGALCCSVLAGLHSFARLRPPPPKNEVCLSRGRLFGNPKIKKTNKKTPRAPRRPSRHPVHRWQCGLCAQLPSWSRESN